MTDYKKIIESFQEDLIKSAQECVKIKSISGNSEGTKKALLFYLDLGQNMGFKATNIEDLGGVIEYGEGDKTIGMIVHLDVVPEGTGWNFPPFDGQIQDGKLYGRGAIDDKGPAISALYALKAFKESGIKPHCKIQIIIGIDEESVWNTTPKMLEKIKEPDFSFVPDSKFPIIIAEKGLIWIEVNGNFASSNHSDQPYNSGIVIQNMIGGGTDSLNIVPDHCEVTLQATQSQAAELMKRLADFTHQTKYDIKLDQNSPAQNNSTLKLISRGKSGHAFNCQEGQNAISQLILFLAQLDITNEQKDFIQTCSEKIGIEYDGESLGLAVEDDLTGNLTVSPGYLSLDDKQFTLQVDIRFPSSQTLNEMKPKVIKAFDVFQGSMTIIDSLESLSFPEDDPHIRSLLQVYRDFTGDQEAKPLGMGGTTFSKAFKHAVAFGPSFPGMAKVEHQPDEYMEIEHLIKCTEIYALAIEELSKESS